MLLEPDIDVSAVREWCVSVGINATINPTIYRGRIRHYEATMSPDDMFLFRFRWDEKPAPSVTTMRVHCNEEEPAFSLHKLGRARGVL